MRIAVFHELSEGGAKRVVEEEIKRLGRRHKVEVFASSARCEPSPPLRCEADFFKFWTLRKIQQKLAREIDEKDYDLVLVHPSKYTQAPYLLRYLKTPSLYYAHETLRICYEDNLRFQEKVNLFKKLYEKMYRLLLKKTDLVNLRSAHKVVVNSFQTKKAILQAYSIETEVCYPGVDVNLFGPLAGAKKEGILFVAKPSKTTGFDFLKQALSLIKPRPKLKIVSGNLSEDELIKAYNEANLTVCTSELEPFGLVPLESMACETPPIAVKEGGYRETIVDGETGFLIERNPRLFGQKIKLILDNSPLRDKMGKTGREYVKKQWTWERHIQCLEKILQSQF